MAYKFQLGAAILSGSLTQEGEVLAKDSTLSGSSLSIAGTAVSSTAAELNLVDGSSAGSVVNNKAVVYGASGQVNGTSVSASAGLSGGSITLGNASGLAESGGGLANADGKLELEMVSAGATVAVADDTFYFADANNGDNIRSGSFVDLASGMAGDGLTAASGVIAANVAAAGGIEVDTDALQIKVATVAGLETDSNGLKLRLGASAGLEISGSGPGELNVKLSGSSLTKDGGGVKINAGGVSNAMLGGSINPNKVTVASANIIVGNGSSVGAAVAMSGDIAIDQAGETTIQANAVEGSMLNSNVADTSTIEVSSNTLSVLKIPNALTAGNGIAAAGTFDGAAARSFAIERSGSTSGLSLNADGVAVALSSSGGLGADANGVFVALPSGAGLELAADGLKIEAGGVTNAMLSGSIANAKLANSSITLTQGAGMAALGAVSLGGSVTVAVDGVLEDLDTLGAAGSDGQFIVATGAGAFAYESGATVRTSLGLGTGNNVQFTDLTLTGDLTVQGTTTTISTTNLEVEDKNILIASGASDAASAAGAGLTVGFSNVQWKYEANGENVGGVDASSSGNIWIASSSAGLVDVQAAKFYGDGSDITGISAETVLYSVASKADGDTLEEKKVNYFADLSSNATVTMPSVDNNDIGAQLFIKAKDLTNSATIIINTAAAAQKIDGQNSITLESPYAAVTLIYVATDDWRVF